MNKTNRRNCAGFALEALNACQGNQDPIDPLIEALLAALRHDRTPTPFRVTCALLDLKDERKQSA